jgi:hypothetical protein
MKRLQYTVRQKKSRRPAAVAQVRVRVRPLRQAKKASPRKRRMLPFLKRLLWIAAVSALILGGLLYPFDSPVVPAWSVQVVDESDHPVAGVDVQQEWGQYGADQMIWADSRITGPDGRVVFPVRTVRASLGPRALSYFLEVGMLPPPNNEKRIPASHLFVCRQGKTGEIVWEQGKGQPPERMLLRNGFCRYGQQGA